jgi:hypothetical protein
MEKLKYKNKLDDLLELFGRPDSTIKIEDKIAMYNDSIIEIYYYKFADFVVYKKKAELVKIKFINSDAKMVFPNFTISSETKIEEIKTKFPCVYKYQIDTFRNQITDEKLICFWFSTLKDSESRWLIFFKDNYICKAEYFIPD